MRTAESERENEDIQPQRRIIANSQALTICKAYVNAYLDKSRRVPYQKSTSTNDTIRSVLTSYEADLIFTRLLEVSKLFALTTTTPKETTLTPSKTTSNTVTQGITTAQATTTTSVPLASFKCAVYPDLYIQPWHPTNQASPPIRSCLGTSGNFELVKNKYVRVTGRTSSSLTLVLFDETSTNAICTVAAVGQDAAWADCEENGIYPSLIKTATHETLTVYYAKANFTTIVTRDVSIFVL
ncbi:unnamed protein product [Rotaria sp. Silwood2]|nr:unnamed protein product [Rotaria sp. Silwood2]CAF3340902.1 unnamed protein product [Rotaria sp. Silwood2]CAF4329465.1 unnamed protein product [Rotaria sp. Silwood2]CAF4380623.1 unnamed protein product [Rotaria sp. Silwood2]